MGTNKTLAIKHQLNVVVEVIAILMVVAYTLITMGLGLFLGFGFSRRFAINDCMIDNNVRYPSVDLQILAFIAAYLSTLVIAGILLIEVSRSDLYAKIFAGIHGSVILFFMLLMAAVFR